ncbi:MAG TPA: hypothetical protein VGO00_27815 [Kofleriaceae bacterium]|nr:hypothetical protein [Kofleriaceae bacterium]
MRFVGILITGMIVASCSSSSQPTPAPTPPTTTPTPIPTTPTTPTPHPDAKVARKPVQHRGDDAGTCDRTPKPPGSARSELQGCKSDKECKSGKNGRCNTRGGGHSIEMNRCEYDGCFADTDCPNGGVCNCAGTGNYCMTSTCRHDADCADGGACSPVPGCFGVEGYSCHTSKDECIDDDDCKQDNTYRRCRYQGELGHWACAVMQCPVG